ncbi:MAG: hypothetical protein H6Q93_1557, partial [Nitrospirae bacterium]|nr:hypothetical protein [Nitrospirota bacterium]
MRGVGMKARKEAFISEDSKKIIKKELDNLTNPVSVLLFTSEEENKPFNEFSIKLFTELSQISDKIQPKFEKIGSELSKKHNVTRSPTIVIQPDKY